MTHSATFLVDLRNQKTELAGAYEGRVQMLNHWYHMPKLEGKHDFERGQRASEIPGT
jgi:hypothetical protein